MNKEETALLEEAEKAEKEKAGKKDEKDAKKKKRMPTKIRRKGRAVEVRSCKPL